MKSKRFISLSLMLGLTAGMFIGISSSNKNGEVLVVDAASWNAYTHYDGATYYNGISDTAEGAALTSALRSLNNSKKKKEGGYSALLKSNFWAQYTDFDCKSSYSQDTAHNLPYSSKIVSFYSGNIANNAAGMNREHVWPNSKGGSMVEDDTHMARPTLSSENSARGNSFYVEGKQDRTYGWDPAMETWGDATYRGDSARIIFYCAIANSNLTLVDKESDTNSNNTMGKLSDLLKWNLAYPVQQREMNRNEAVEAIQGNRNPFIDHPEYACRIWGNTNTTTRQICGTPSLSLSSTSMTVYQGHTAQISGTSSHNTSINWSCSDTSILSISKAISDSGERVTVTGRALGSATITATTVINGETLTKECAVTVSEVPPLKSVSLNATSISLSIDRTYQLKVIPNPTAADLPAFTWTSSDTGIATVSSDGLVTAKGAGSATITAKSTDPAYTLTCAVTVSAPAPAPSSGGCGGNVITTSVILSTLSVLGIGLILIKRKFIK